MCKESLIDFSKYTITEDGTIFSKSYNKNRNLEGSFDKDGYVLIKFKCSDGKQRFFRLHRVIYYFFKGDIPQGYQVHHINKNKLNNSIENIELLSKDEHNRLHQIEKTKNHIRQFDLKTKETIKIWLNTREIERELGFNHTNIYHCCKGGFFYNSKWINVHQAYGFGWELI